MRIGLILTLLVVAVPAVAQNTTIRNRAGDLIGKTQERGDRTYLLDKAGNPQGYSVKLPNGSTQFRTNAGDLIGTDTPHR